MPTYTNTLRLNDSIISVERVDLSQFSLVAAYRYTSKGSSPKNIHDRDALQKPDGTLLNANATFLEAEVDNQANPPVFEQIVLDTSSAFDGGTALTIHQYETFVPFTYPGTIDTLKIEEDEDRTITQGGGTFSFDYKEGAISLVTESPVTAEVKATVFEIIQSASTLSSSDFSFSGALGLWSPNQWASVKAEGLNPEPTSSSRNTTYLETIDFKGFRLVEDFGEATYEKDVVRFNNSTAIRQFGSANTVAGAAAGEQVEQTQLIVSPIEFGPEDPVGNSYVLDINLKPFTSLDDGTLIYKKTIIKTDTILAKVDDGTPYS
jgi:hypothetical protein